MEHNTIRFAELLELHINNSIKSKFTTAPDGLTPAMMKEVRNEIRHRIDSVFTKSKHKLTDKASSWLTDQFFKRVRVNDEQVMSDLVVMNEYKLSQLSYDDVQLLKNLFNRTQFAEELEEEYRRRSTS